MFYCLIDHKPISYRRYGDNKFLLFLTELHEKINLNYINPKQRNVRFTIKREENNSLSFLDIKIILDSGKSHTSVERKTTFSGVLTNFENFSRTLILFPCNYIVVL